MSWETWLDKLKFVPISERPLHQIVQWYSVCLIRTNKSIKKVKVPQSENVWQIIHGFAIKKKSSDWGNRWGDQI